MGLSPNTAKHATPYLMNETAKRWLRDLRTSNPFFMYLHYNEPHRPYVPPLPYLDLFMEDIDFSPRDAARRALEIHYNIDQHIANNLQGLDENDFEALTAMYDAEIAYTDEMIGRLFSHVQSLGLGETILVITADHGELLGEKGLLSHKVVVDDALTHVPLVVHGPEDIIPESTELAQHIDVMKTLLEIAGADTSQFDGIDLREETRDFAFVNRGEFDFSIFKDHNQSFDSSHFHHGKVVAAVDNEFRYERSDGLTKLIQYPDEVEDVSQRHPGILDKMQRVVQEWEKTKGQPIDADQESGLSANMKQQLRDLGYVE